MYSLPGAYHKRAFSLGKKDSEYEEDRRDEGTPRVSIPAVVYLHCGLLLYVRRLLHEILVVEVTSSNFSPTSSAKIFISGLYVVLKRHMLITYCLYVIGFVMSVLSLKKGKYMYQFGQYSWTITIILFVLVQTSFFVSNIFEGLIW